MNRSCSIKHNFCAALAAASTLLATHVFGQVLLSGGTYTQNFDSLPSTAVSSNAWANNSTLQGWYAEAVLSPVVWGTGGECTNILANSGAGTAGALYSFGTNGVNPVTDRALGSICANSLAPSGQPAVAYGVRMTNDTGVPLTNFVVSYTGKQWRDNNTTAQSLFFAYRIDGVPITSADPSSANTWTPVASLNFTTPIHGNTGALDGNATANKTSFNSVALSGFVVFPGQEIFFRWLDVNDSGNDSALSIDDLSISFSTNLNAVESGPGISGQPTNLVTMEGNTAQFKVTADGTQPLSYQWYQTNSGGITLLDGATAATYTTNFVPVSLSGNGYFVVISNNAPVDNVVTSLVATLTVTNAIPVVTNIAYLHTLHNANYALTDTNTLYQVEGIVTTSGDLVSSGGQSAYFQDASGAGMDLFFFTGTAGFSLPNIGDHIRVTGQLSQFDGALEIQLTANPAHKLEVLDSGNPEPQPNYFDFSKGISPPAMEGYLTNGTTIVPAVEGSYVIISNVFLGTTNSGGLLAPDQTIFATNLTGQTFQLHVPNNPVSQTALTSLPGTFAKSVRGVMAQFQTSGTVLTNNYQMYYDLMANIEVGTPPAPAPSITGIALDSTGSNIIISGTNNNGTTAGNYVVLVSTNIALPITNWTPLSTQTFDQTGAFNYTNAIGTTNTSLYYILQALP